MYLVYILYIHFFDKNWMSDPVLSLTASFNREKSKQAKCGLYVLIIILKDRKT